VRWRSRGRWQVEGVREEVKCRSGEESRGGVGVNVKWRTREGEVEDAWVWSRGRVIIRWGRDVPDKSESLIEMLSCTLQLQLFLFALVEYCLFACWMFFVCFLNCFCLPKKVRANEVLSVLSKGYSLTRSASLEFTGSCSKNHLTLETPPTSILLPWSKNPTLKQEAENSSYELQGRRLDSCFKLLGISTFSSIYLPNDKTKWYNIYSI